MSNAIETPEEIERNAELLFISFQKYKSLKYGPKNLLESWNGIKDNACDTTFLVHGGRNAWFALLIARNQLSPEAHFQNKNAYIKLISDLKTRPPPFREKIASRLKVLISEAGGDNGKKVESFLDNKLGSGSTTTMSAAVQKQPRTSDAARSDSTDTMPATGRKRPRTTEADDPGSATDTTFRSPDATTPVATPIPPPQHDSPSFHNPRTTCAMPTGVYANTAKNPPLDKLGSLQLPTEIEDAIIRIPDSVDKDHYVAGLSMMIPSSASDESQGCLMILQIAAERAPHLVTKLFNIELQQRLIGRVCCLSDSTTVIPNPASQIVGCAFRVIDEFGPVLAKAIKASIPYQIDSKQQRRKTDSITMGFSMDGSEPVQIMICLGTYQGIAIHKQLFTRQI